MSASITELPQPTPQEQTVCDELKQVVLAEIDSSGGSISFQRYMEMVLYTPKLGYYVNGRRIIGEQGDFTTGPELSPLFAQCLARQYMELAEQLDGVLSVLEFGGGSGAMVTEFLAYLESENKLPAEYLILDVSPYLQAEQKDRLAARLPHLLPRVKWVTAVPEGFRGMVLANEVLDAMPVHRIRFQPDGRHQELSVVRQGQDIREKPIPLTDAELAREATRICDEAGPFAAGYETEINLFSRGWLTALYQQMAEGVVILIDYGYPRRHWYIPDRKDGTLMCHYHHRAHSDPYIFPGIQDLTAHVDFTTVAEQAVEAGFQVGGYTTQSYFLTGAGIETLLRALDDSDLVTFLSTTGPIKKLLLPQEMGEIFKVIALSKGQEVAFSGFGLNDLRAQL